MSMTLALTTNDTTSDVSTDIDPKAAFREFRTAVDQYTKDLGPWRTVEHAYGLLKAISTPDEMSALWAKAKQAGRAGLLAHPLIPLYLYGQLRDARYRQSPLAKARAKARDARRKLDPKRREQVKAADQRYRAKKRAEKGGSQ
jgi:hypothetical protein